MGRGRRWMGDEERKEIIKVRMEGEREGGVRGEREYMS